MHHLPHKQQQQQVPRDPSFYLTHRAPLATFDTVDLSDDDLSLSSARVSLSSSPARSITNTSGTPTPSHSPRSSRSGGQSCSPARSGHSGASPSHSPSFFRKVRGGGGPASQSVPASEYLVRSLHIGNSPSHSPDLAASLVRSLQGETSFPYPHTVQASDPVSSFRGGAAQRPASLGTKIGGAQSKGKGPASKHVEQDPHPAQAASDHGDDETPVACSPPLNTEHFNDVDAETPTPTYQGSACVAGQDLTRTDDNTDGAVCGRIELEAAGESSTDPCAKNSEESGGGGGGEEAGAEVFRAHQQQPLSQPPPVPPRTSCPPPPQRIGKIVGSWAHPPDSDSSSSSSDSGSETITFRPIKGLASASATQDDDDNDDDDDDDTPQTRRRLILREKSTDYSLNLYPEDLDPAQITSPSKRKAYEKRLQRLQVKTSPRVRPRSTTPINVVTLDEYVLSSPEVSPATPSQEKLRISLPASSDYSSKHKSSRHHSRRKHAHHHHPEQEEDPCFVFDEKILFSHTRSALVVEQAGQIPTAGSPRRVLIPPTLSPSSSPKLTRAPVSNSRASPQLVYIKGEEGEKETKENDKDTEEDFFGQPAQSVSNDNWAVFPDETDATERSTDSSKEEGAEDSEDRLPNSSDSERIGSDSEPEADSGAEAAKLEPETNQTCEAKSETEAKFENKQKVIDEVLDTEPKLENELELETKVETGIVLETKPETKPRPEKATGGVSILAAVVAASQEVEDEILTVSYESVAACKPANIEVILTGASSSNTPSPSTPDSDEALKEAAQDKAAQRQTVQQQASQQQAAQQPAVPPKAAAETIVQKPPPPPRKSPVNVPPVNVPPVNVAPVNIPPKAPANAPPPAARPPPIPPRRRPPPPPPPHSHPPPDVVPGDDGVDPLTVKCDLLVDIDSQ